MPVRVLRHFHYVIRHKELDSGFKIIPKTVSKTGVCGCCTSVRSRFSFIDETLISFDNEPSSNTLFSALFIFSEKFKNIIRYPAMESCNEVLKNACYESLDKESTSEPVNEKSVSEADDGKCEDTLRLERNKFEDVGKVASVLKSHWKEIEESVHSNKSKDKVKKKKKKKNKNKRFLDVDCEEGSSDEDSGLKVRYPNRNFIGFEELSNACRSVIIQCCSSFETSNVVLKKTWSDTEDVPEEKDDEEKVVSIISKLPIYGEVSLLTIADSLVSVIELEILPFLTVNAQ